MNGPRLRFPSLVAAALLFGGSLVARPALAALGETISVKETRTTTVANHTVRFRETNGVREYAGDDGKIFAFTWRGMARAPLQLLGSYASSFQAGFAGRRLHGHHHVYFATPNLVYMSFVGPRVRFGHAYDPTHLPKGVTIDALP